MTKYTGDEIMSEETKQDQNPTEAVPEGVFYDGKITVTINMPASLFLDDLAEACSRTPQQQVTFLINQAWRQLAAEVQIARNLRNRVVGDMGPLKAMLE